MSTYRKTTKVTKLKNGLFSQPAFHICGEGLFECSHCSRVFCPECDFNVHMDKCCAKAVEELEEARYQKKKAKESLKEKLKKRRERVEVKIEEIGTEL